MLNKLTKKLLTLTPIETAQLTDHQSHDNLLSQLPFEIKKTNNIPVISQNLIGNKNIYINKHNRFCKYPLHSHTFTEINYVYQGSANEIVNKKHLTLKKGDFLLMAPGTSHSIDTLTKKDILINIIINSDIYNFESLIQIDHDYLKQVYLSNVLSSNYLLFRAENTEKELRTIANTIIEEYYFPNDLSQNILAHLSKIFFMLLYRNINISSSDNISEHDTKIIPLILREIMDNYQSINLNQLAEKYNYNKNYLSNLFKQNIGQTFSKVLLRKKLSESYKDIITNPSKPIQQIILDHGFTNKTFFIRNLKQNITLNLIKLEKITENNS